MREGGGREEEAEENPLEDGEIDEKGQRRRRKSKGKEKAQKRRGDALPSTPKAPTQGGSGGGGGGQSLSSSVAGGGGGVAFEEIQLRAHVREGHFELVDFVVGARGDTRRSGSRARAGFGEAAAAARFDQDDLVCLWLPLRNADTVGKRVIFFCFIPCFSLTRKEKKNWGFGGGGLCCAVLSIR